MKRLIEWLYRTAFGINVRIQDRSIGDIERRLSYLIDERTFIADEIEAVTSQLLAAQERRDRLANRIDRRTASIVTAWHVDKVYAAKDCLQQPTNHQEQP